MTQRPVSEFSRVISRHLSAFMHERHITDEAVGLRIGKGRSYVSEHTNGTRPLETDIIDAVADLAEVETPALLAELQRRMAAPLDPRESDDEKARRLAVQAAERRRLASQPPSTRRRGKA